MPYLPRLGVTVFFDDTGGQEYGLVTGSFADSAALDHHVTQLLSHLRHCSPASLRWTKHCLETPRIGNSSRGGFLAGQRLSELRAPTFPLSLLAAIWNGTVADVEAVDVNAQVETMASRDYVNGVEALVQGRLFDYVDEAMGGMR